MANDLLLDEKGDLVIDPTTGDFATTNSIDEVAQRIRATLSIRYGEMPNLDAEMGTDYTDFLGKRFNEESAAMQLRQTIRNDVPEVDSIEDITFKEVPNRHLMVGFKATATPTEETISQNLEGGAELGD